MLRFRKAKTNCPPRLHFQTLIDEKPGILIFGIKGLKRNGGFLLTFAKIASTVKNDLCACTD